MTIDVVEVLRRSDQGATEPFICRCSDGEIYFVKGSGAGRRSQICEWVAGCLAQALGLPIAPFRIVKVPPELLELGAGLDLSDLGVGPAFGSRKHMLTELSYAAIEEIPQSVQLDVFAFDWWIRNGDRFLTEQGGNPNLFWEAGKKELVVLDQNQAFDATFSETDFFKYHTFAGCGHILTSDLALQNSYAQKFSQALIEWPEICNTIPEEWWFSDPEMTVPVDFDPVAVRALLARYQAPNFWTAP
jgi:hypothetical protein